MGVFRGVVLRPGDLDLLGWTLCESIEMLWSLLAASIRGLQACMFYDQRDAERERGREGVSE